MDPKKASRLASEAGGVARDAESTEVVFLGASSVEKMRMILPPEMHRLVVIEPDPKRLANLLAGIELMPPLRSGDFDVLSDPDPAIIIERWQDERRRRTLSKLMLVDAAGDDPSRRRYFETVRSGIEAKERDQALDTGAMVALGALSVKNALDNLAMPGKGFPKPLSRALAGHPAIVVSAGPSLDANLEKLGDPSDRAVVIAVDTAVTPLARVGIEPDLVIGVDPRERNVHNVQGVDLRHACLVGEISCHPDWMMPPAAGRAFVGNDGAISAALAKVDFALPTLPMYGSVATAALSLACRMKLDPIVFVGQDLAFSDGLEYSPHIDKNAFVSAPLDERRWEKDLYGEPVQTTERLVAFRDWLEATMAAHAGTTFVNATGAGILERGVDQVDASELRDRVLSQTLDPARLRATITSAISSERDFDGRGTLSRLHEQIDACRVPLMSGARDSRVFLAPYLERDAVVGLVEVLRANPLRELSSSWNRLSKASRDRRLRRTLLSGIHELDDMVDDAMAIGAHR